MKPSKSWVVRKLGIPRNIHPGLYAIDVQAD
jgi:transcription elongation factor SPT4